MRNVKLFFKIFFIVPIFKHVANECVGKDIILNIWDWKLLIRVTDNLLSPCDPDWKVQV